MGLFDHVNFETECPVCSHKVTGFQTKDSICCLETVEPWTVRNFYSSCPNCDTWIEYTFNHEHIENVKCLLDHAVSLLKRLRDVVCEQDIEEINNFLDGCPNENWQANYSLVYAKNQPWKYLSNE